MKKIICAVLLLIALSVQAQKATSGLQFCISVNEEFQPVNTTNEITLRDEQANILYYYWNEIAISSPSLVYKTFAVDKVGKETLSGTIVQTIQPAWRFVKQTADFTKAGNYHIKVYNASGEELASAMLTVK